ncbi:phosphatidate cytidylyltransferase [Oceanicoccus sagamiensis]|uniref:Phosphatidate cytidylyltransferase n=1 Tax=Oceanicoccus sagamiensis TaxID=716816 RepID=A0A1X9NCV8_9GAMM|nr:phosphatidate cytidylyltransferase [Oceanicoccus sagamiensis]ARN74991.1 phosphatidate cytidylyltransferase [Oceanicoccus sagamiensis]
MLKQRIITAVIMITLIGAGIFLLPPLGLAGLIGLLVVIAAWEWSALAGLTSAITKVLFTLSVLALLALSAWHTQILTAHADWDRVRDILGLGCLWWAIALLWVRSYPGSAVIWRSTPMRLLMGFVTLVPAWLALVYLRVHSHGIALIFLLIAMVAAADIGAYFSGLRWGKAKLAPNVSPGKSWAGFWGGLVASTGLVLIVWLLFGSAEHGLAAVITVAIVTSLASVLGDLLESMIKRQQGVKDSGRILPGHGGMMDRLDSMTAAAPVFALSLLLAGW